MVDLGFGRVLRSMRKLSTHETTLQLLRGTPTHVLLEPQATPITRYPTVDGVSHDSRDEQAQGAEQTPKPTATTNAEVSSDPQRRVTFAVQLPVFEKQHGGIGAFHRDVRPRRPMLTKRRLKRRKPKMSVGVSGNDELHRRATQRAVAVEEDHWRSRRLGLLSHAALSLVL